MSSSTELAGRVKAAKERLDARVREMVEWHFNPATGCQFWLNKATELGFDPRREGEVFRGPAQVPAV